MRPTAISLFSGAGGLDYGFEAAGFETRVCVEIDSDACETIRSNRPWTILEEDALTLETSAILEAAQLEPKEADVLIGGPPCQPFSKSGFWARGDTLRLDDPRAATLVAFMRVWEESLPATVMLENVPGFAYRGKSEALSFVEERIGEINAKSGVTYQPQYTVVNAADYGVPQLRQRFILVASRDGATFEFPPPTHGTTNRQPNLSSNNELQEYRTTWDAIGDLESEPVDGLVPTGRWAELLPSIPEGHNYLFHTQRGEGLPLFGWRRRYWSFLLKLAKSQPSWTIQAAPGPATGPFHWSNRRLSIRELGRLQTFPDDVDIVGGDRSARRQIGNAVPALLAEIFARSIGEQLLKLEPSETKMRLLHLARPNLPLPQVPAEVPEKYLDLLNSDDSHPGTGLGRAALLRV